MAASSADKMPTAVARDEATSQPPSRGHVRDRYTSCRREERNWRLETEQKRRYPVRVRTVRLTTRVHPDMLVPYLYGERGGRSINAIVNATGCTIDYCALSPEEPDRSPQSFGFVMNFLVSADSSAMLEEATRELRVLVERLQVFLQKKASRGSRSTERERVYPRQYYGPSRDVVRSQERWTDRAWREDEASYTDTPMQRMPYAGVAPRQSRKRPRYQGREMEEADEKRSHFMMPQGPKRRSIEYEDEVATQQRSHAVFPRRVRAYSQYAAPWNASRLYPDERRREARYPIHAAARAQMGEGQAVRRARTREPPWIYHEAPPRRYTEVPWYEDDEVSDEEMADLFPYDEPRDGRNENVEVFDVRNELDPNEMLLESRRRFQRPLSHKRPRTRMYRQGIPRIYDDIDIDDEDEEWISEEEEEEEEAEEEEEEEEEELRHGYVYTSQSPSATIPFRRRRHKSSLSVSSPRWICGNRLGRAEAQPIYKRRRFSRERMPLKNERMQDVLFETQDRNPACSSHSDLDTEIVEHHQKDTRKTNPSAFSDPTRIIQAEILTEKETEVLNPSVDQADSSSDFHLGETEALNNATTLGLLEGLDSDADAVKETDSTTGETMSEQLDSSVNHEECHSTSHTPSVEEEESLSIGYQASSDDVASELHLSKVEHTAGFVSPPSGAKDSIPSSPVTTKESPENHVASPVASFENYTDQNVTVAAETRPENAIVPEISSEKSVVKDCNANEDIFCFHPVVEIENPDTENGRISTQAIASLKRLNQVEAEFLLAQSSLVAQKAKWRQVQTKHKRHRRLERLCDLVYQLQCHVGARSCGLDVSCKEALLARLDTYVEKLVAFNGESLHETIEELKNAVDEALPKDFLRCRKAQDTEALESMSQLKSLNTNETDEMNGHDDEWPVDGEALDDVVTSIDCEKPSTRDDHSVDKKKKTEALACRPRELPGFIWSLLAQGLACNPQSYVMRVTQKRVVDEIVQGDPYYYLHPTRESKMTSPLSSSGCDFGCRGASAMQLERKLVAQISSRMKAFDMLAYALARSNEEGTQQVLSRKKINSSIRKLHLVAVQLHALVSHLYCVKGHGRCHEGNALPNALNRMQYERKKSVYKSRLKLVVPLPCHAADAAPDERDDELYRETYEFFPELLVCVDMWGYNYRESLAKQPSSVVESTRFPLEFFRQVEDLAFDYEHDANGLLRCICDELLNIVCRWNDFKWKEPLKEMTVEQIWTFESNVMKSIGTILDLYAHHLQALWSIRLLDNPMELESVHFTHLHAYYSDRSQENGALGHSNQVNERMEQCLAETYWNEKVTTVSMQTEREKEQDEEKEQELETTWQQVASLDAMWKWNDEMIKASRLRWSEVYAMRHHVTALAGVTNYMIHHELEQIKLPNGWTQDERTTDTMTRQLLAAGSRARMLLQDALLASEKLARHSAAVQLPIEKKKKKKKEMDDNEEEGAREVNIVDKSGEEWTKGDNMNGEQPELTDLIQLVAVTKEEMQEVCSHRPRSARMREKVQTQSMQLARQTVEIFRNIRIMYTTERR